MTIFFKYVVINVSRFQKDTSYLDHGIFLLYQPCRKHIQLPDNSISYLPQQSKLNITSLLERKSNANYQSSITKLVSEAIICKCRQVAIQNGRTVCFYNLCGCIHRFMTTLNAYSSLLPTRERYVPRTFVHIALSRKNQLQQTQLETKHLSSSSQLF